MSTFFHRAWANTWVAPTIFLLLASFAVFVLIYQFTAPLTIDIGRGNDTPFIHGFSFRENLSAGDFRWSSGRAEIRFWGIGAQEGTLTLRLAAPRPTGVARVEIFANGHLLDTIQLGTNFQEFKFWIDREIFDVRGDLVVTLISDTFTQAPDDRALGVQVDYARFQRGDGWVSSSPRAIYLVALVLLTFVVARVWSGNLGVGIATGILTILLAVVELVAARVETIWFAAPLFWFGVALLLGALAFARLLKYFAGTSLPMRAIFAAMVVALAVRMVFAVGPGFIVDVQDYVVWSYKTVTYGLGSAYTAVNGLWIADQSPGLVYVLHVMGLIYRAVFSSDFLYPGVAGDPAIRAWATNPALLADPVQRTLLRMPALFADLATGALIFAAARKYFSARGAWLVALGYWFNPAVLWNGAYWGQTDAIHSLLVLIAFLLLDKKRIGASFLILGIAALTKPQAAIFAPLLLFWAYRAGKWRGVARVCFAGALGTLFMLTPMLAVGSASGMLAYFADTVGHHPILSANAHNLWWFLTEGQIDVLDTAQVISGIPITFRATSIALFAAFYLAVLFKAWRTRQPDYFALGACIAFAFFMLPTEIHENYGYALLPLLAVAMSRDRNWLFIYLAVTATMVLNYALSDPALFAWLGLNNPDIQLAAPRLRNAAINVGLFEVWAVYLFTRRNVTKGATV